jgi:sialic acid synthase SpsE
MLILDFGSGNTCKNDEKTIKAMFDELDAAVPPVFEHHQPVVKFQLFKDEPPNIPLSDEAFDFAYEYGTGLGFQVTASVFDVDAALYLMTYDVPFIKLANRPNLGHVANIIRPFEIDVIQSVPSSAEFVLCQEATPLCCVSEYPALPHQYRDRFERGQLREGISDHTAGWGLYHLYKPRIIEKHYVLEHDDSNPDAGSFAATPEDIVQLYQEARP